MKVAALQQFLHGLAQPLQAAGASQKLLQDLEETRQALEPFKEFEFAPFAAFLRQAEEYHRTGVLPVRARAPRAAKRLDAAKIHEVAQQAVQLKERAAGTDSPTDAIQADFDRLGLNALSKKDVQALARELGVRATVRMTPEEGIAAIRLWAFGSYETPQAPKREHVPVTPAAEKVPMAAGEVREQQPV
jgi:hypothetical protein